MPHVHNGIGTWYYGKRNIQQRTGQCAACKSVSNLTTYDTRSFFVVFMVPLIPLRKLHIVDQCARCKRHGVIPWAEWETAQKRMQNAIDAYRRSPTNAQLAEEVIRTIVPYRDAAAFLSIAPEIEKNLARSTKTLGLVAGVYDLLGRGGDVERVLRAALAVEDTAEIREALADCLMDQGRADDAEPYLEH